MVGAKLVFRNSDIARGYHRGFGQIHAERDLLMNYQGDIPSEAILYVNLEPCCHQGKTPPCTDIILKRGVQRVCFGMPDPDVRVAGQGIDLLRRNGVEVIGPVARAACEYFNRGFVTMRSKGRPWVILKSARTRDGQIAYADGAPLKITNEEQDRWSHEHLRSKVDAILVGVQTIINDDPHLTTRLVSTPQQEGLERYQPWRIIFDSSLRIPLASRVLTDPQASKTIVVTAPEAPSGNKVALRGRGVRVFEVPLKEGSFAFGKLWEVLSSPTADFKGMTSLLVEGGAKTWDTFRKAGVVDEEVTLTSTL